MEAVARRVARVGTLLLVLGLGWSSAAPAQDGDCGDGFAPDGTLGNCADGGGDDGTGTSPSDPVDATDPGSAGADPLAPPSTVGNPVSLFSGNKRELETDFAIPGSELVFRRTYNSANEPWRAGVGQGWTHTYAVTLFATPEGGRQILQGDGRRLHFAPAGTDAAGRAIFRSGSAFEGIVSVDAEGVHRWALPDGRTLRFNGGYLVEIDWPDQRRLSLYYERRRLASVTDETGRVLRFAYWPGAPGSERALGGYDEQEFGPAAGQLSALTLPDGSVIGYDYDERSNLTRVRFPDGTARRYHYEDEGYPSHLTGLTERTGVRVRTWAYDAAGRAILSERAGGVGRVELTHPDRRAVEAGREVVTRITNSLGQESEYRWQQLVGGAPRLLEGTGSGCSSCPPTGVRWDYDGAGRLIAAVQVGGGTAIGAPGTATRYAYDEAGRLAEVRRTDAVGTEHLVERREYADGTSLVPVRLVRPSVNPDGERVTEIERDERGLVTAVTERGWAPVLAAHGQQAPTSVHEPTGYRPIERVTTLTYDDRDRLVAIDGPRTGVQDVVRLAYDERSRLAAIAPPSSPILHLESYDASGRLTSYRLGARPEVVLTRDGEGRVVRSRQGERINTFAYDADGRMTSVGDTDGRTVRMRFDPAGRLAAVTDDLGRVQDLEHDGEGRLAARSALAADGALIHSLETAFEPRGRPGRVTERRPDNRGLTDARTVDIAAVDDARTSTTDFTDASGAGSTQVRVDRLTRLTETVRTGGERTVIGVDALDRIASVTDARGNTTTHYRDDFGRSVILSSVDAGVLVQTHDPAGNVTETRDASGRTSRSRYDAADRLVERTDEDGTTRWRWDALTGGLAGVSNPHGEERFAYDDAGLLASHVRTIDGHRFETRYRYDARGRLTRTTLPDGQSLRYRYHEDGPERARLRSIARSSWGGLRERVLVDRIDQDARDGDGGYVSGAGVRTDHRYAPNGQIRSIDIGGTLELDYRVDADGRVVGIDENGEAQHYAYRDGALMMADTLDGVFSYDYDAAGNRTRKRRWRAGELVVDEQCRFDEPGEGNRLLERTDVLTGQAERYDYGELGAPVTRGELRYVYDAKQQPVALYRGERLLARYAYNGFGERIKKVLYDAGGRPTVTYYLYSGGALAAEVDGSGTPTAQYVYLDEHRPVLKLHADEAYVIHTDHLGAPRVMSDEAGRVRRRARYTPFGEAIVERAEVDLPLRLPGQYADAESSTHYNYLRDYDPGTGRYLRADPIGLGGGPNRYGYVSNDPLGVVDPLGLQAVVRSPGAAPDAWRIIRTHGLERYVDLTRAPANQPIPPPRPGVPATGVLRGLARANAVVALASASYVLGAAGAALADALVFAPADQAELVAHIRRYDPNYQPVGVAARLDREGIRELGDVLFGAQLDYLDSVAGACPADQQLYFDARWATEGPGSLSPVSQSSVREQYDRQYRQYQANGGLLSFEDWLAEGMPEGVPYVPTRNLERPHNRHFLASVGRRAQSNPGGNTMILPGVDVDKDLEDIAAGRAIIVNGSDIHINGRVYREHQSRTPGVAALPRLIPVRGDGFEELSQREFNILKQVKGYRQDGLTREQQLAAIRRNPNNQESEIQKAMRLLDLLD